MKELGIEVVKCLKILIMAFIKELKLIAKSGKL
jgi:hypothetical protein